MHGDHKGKHKLLQSEPVYVFWRTLHSRGAGTETQAAPLRRPTNEMAHDEPEFWAGYFDGYTPFLPDAAGIRGPPLPGRARPWCDRAA